MTRDKIMEGIEYAMEPSRKAMLNNKALKPENERRLRRDKKKGDKGLKEIKPRELPTVEKFKKNVIRLMDEDDYWVSYFHREMFTRIYTWYPIIDEICRKEPQPGIYEQSKKMFYDWCRLDGKDHVRPPTQEWIQETERIKQINKSLTKISPKLRCPKCHRFVHYKYQHNVTIPDRSEHTVCQPDCSTAHVKLRKYMDAVIANYRATRRKQEARRIWKAEKKKRRSGNK